MSFRTRFWVGPTHWHADLHDLAVTEAVVERAATDSVAGLEHGDGPAVAPQPASRREPGEARPHDHHIDVMPARRACRGGPRDGRDGVSGGTRGGGSNQPASGEASRLFLSVRHAPRSLATGGIRRKPGRLQKRVEPDREPVRELARVPNREQHAGHERSAIGRVVADREGLPLAAEDHLLVGD